MILWLLARIHKSHATGKKNMYMYMYMYIHLHMTLYGTFTCKKITCTFLTGKAQWNEKHLQWSHGVRL